MKSAPSASRRGFHSASVAQGSSILAPPNAPGLGDVWLVTPSIAIFFEPTCSHACVVWQVEPSIVSCVGMFVLTHVPLYSRSRA